MYDEAQILSKLLYALSAFLGGFWLWDRKRIGDRGDRLEDRIRSVEQYSVGEKKVRQMIVDVVEPVKESQAEIKSDIKLLLQLVIQRNGDGK